VAGERSQGTLVSCELDATTHVDVGVNALGLFFLLAMLHGEVLLLRDNNLVLSVQTALDGK
jgi:hypothetical protein